MKGGVRTDRIVRALHRLKHFQTGTRGVTRAFQRPPPFVPDRVLFARRGRFWCERRGHARDFAPHFRFH